jgi:cytochrome b6-f complex iron-sulfur subunit
MSFGAKMNKTNISRRDFLKLTRTALLAASGLLGLGGLIRFLSYSSQPAAPTEFDLGPASDYLQGSRTVLPEVPALLIHGESGFTALSLVCTHLGCTVESTPDGFACPCHGSRFDLQGKAVRGPASKALVTLHVEVAPDENLHLFTNR